MNEELDAAWRELEAQWDDPKAHERFLIACEHAGDLAEAGRRYRVVKEGDPERREEAAKRIEALIGRAMTKMLSEREPPQEGKRSRVEWVLIGLSATLVVAALYQLFRATH